MADGDADDRYTLLTVLAMLLASLVAAAIGLIGAGLWIPNMMTFAPAFDRGPGEGLAFAIFLFMSAGPVLAGAGLVLGWIAFIARAPRAGVKLALVPPLIWGGLMLAYLGAVTNFCDGHFMCRA